MKQHGEPLVNLLVCKPQPGPCNDTYHASHAMRKWRSGPSQSARHSQAHGLKGWASQHSLLLRAGLKQLPPDDSYSACVRESHKVMFDTAEKAMAAAGIKPRQARAGSSLCVAAPRVSLTAFLPAEACCQHALSCTLCCTVAAGMAAAYQCMPLFVGAGGCRGARTAGSSCQLL